MALILSLKLFFISAGVLFMALGLNVSVPLVTEFLATQVPLMWNFCLSCFKPPYLFVVINGIIISIAASSRFHHSAAVSDVPEPTPPSKAPAVPAYEMKSPPEFTISEPLVVYEPIQEDPPSLEVKAVVVNGLAVVEDVDEKAIDDGTESVWKPLERMDLTESPPEYILATEKPLLSARLDQPQRHETLENIWKAITEGRAIALTDGGSAGPLEATNSVSVRFKKSETLKERMNRMAALAPASGGKLRKEPSPSEDELNRRVEAFIRKFNEGMRLQRQQSLNQYIDMISRGRE